MTGTYKRILVATDGSELALRAVQHAALLAELNGADLYLVTVTPPPSVFATTELGWTIPADIQTEVREADAAVAKKILDNAAAAVSGPVKGTFHRENLAPFEGIIQTSDAVGADLIVMGSHGFQGMNRLILGSQAAKVLVLSKVPVLVVK